MQIPLIHGDALLRALTKLAADVQRARTIESVLTTAVSGLEALGFSVAIIELHDTPRLRPPTYGSRMQRCADALADALARTPSPTGPTVEAVGRGHDALFLPDMQKTTLEWLRDDATNPGVIQAAALLPRCGAIAGLTVRQRLWGTLLVTHDDTRAEDAALVGLLALQLGSALEMADALERLERRQTELALVHELAMAGPHADSTAVCARALTAVCRITASRGASLHRYDIERGEYVQVGDTVGAPASWRPFLSAFRTFRLPPDHPLHGGPLAQPVAGFLPNPADVPEGLKHVAVVPLRIEAQPMGMLSLGREVDAEYTDRDLISAEVLGVQLQSLLERTRLYDEASRLYADLKRSYDQLERTQAELVRHERLAALGELSAVMAHEVRNPLGVIFNSLTTLKRLLHPTGDAEMLLTMVGEEADRLNRIVGDLLDFARPYELARKPIAIEPVVASAVDAATKALTTPNVKVITEFPRELPPFPIDGHLVRQALVNLVVNAVQAMPRGGTITVRATVERHNDSPWLEIHVRDQGVGLTPVAAEKMFQPFFTTKATGTGLGLAVVKRIVDAHQGEVSARPNVDGLGTTFECRFPRLMDSRDGVVTPARAVAAKG
ncbi:MAG: hypothetical protein JNG84_14840 [Archangium sp.]|nr:hypothetical protein [Archangium sp.]